MSIIVASSLKCTSSDPKKKIQNSLNKFLDGASETLGDAFDMVAGLETAVSEISDSMDLLTGSMSSLLQDKLVDFVDTGLQAAKNFIFNKIKLPVAARAQTNAFMTTASKPINKLFKAFGCIGSVIKKAIKKTIKNLLLNMIKKGFINPAECAVEDFMGALVSKVANLMDSIVTPLIGPIDKLFSIVGKGFGSVKGFLAGGINMLSKVTGLLNCAAGGGAKCHVVEEYDLNRGSIKGKTSEAKKQNGIAKIFTKASEKLDKLGEGLDKKTGNWKKLLEEDENFKRDEVTCNTGNIFDCGLPRVEFFGGGGEGAVGDILLGNFIQELDTAIEDTVINVGAGETSSIRESTSGGSLLQNVKTTASVIGVDITYPGEGYTSEPFVSFVDNCDQGYGAYGRATIDKDPNSPTYGQVTSVIMIEEGLNYPTGLDADVFVDHVEIENGGQGYTLDDDLGDFKICGVDENGKITEMCPNDKAYRTLPAINPISITGTGAILTPVMTRKARTLGVTNVIDCIAPRNNGIVGFVDGKPYRGPFHLHPTRGVKMVGVAHTSAAHAIIYNTPQESLRSEGAPVSNIGSTKVKLRPISQLIKESETQTVTPESQSTSTPSADTYSDPVDESQNNTPPPSPPSSPPPSSPPPSPPPSSGSSGGGYGY